MCDPCRATARHQAGRSRDRPRRIAPTSRGHDPRGVSSSSPRAGSICALARNWSSPLSQPSDRPVAPAPAPIFLPRPSPALVATHALPAAASRPLPQQSMIISREVCNARRTTATQQRRPLYPSTATSDARRPCTDDAPAAPPLLRRPRSGPGPCAVTPLHHWLRRLFLRLPRPAPPPVTARQAAWLARSAVPTVADEAARVRAEERRSLSPSETV